MKTLLSAVLILFCFLSSCATTGTNQKLATEEQKIITFSEKISITKDKAFALIMEDLAERYNSANSVIQYQDKEAGTIVGKAMILLERNAYGIEKYLHYTLTIKLQSDKANFKFVAGELEAFGLGKPVKMIITEMGMVIAKMRFQEFKDFVMNKIKSSE